MRSFLLAFVSVLALTGSAFAADPNCVAIPEEVASLEHVGMGSGPHGDYVVLDAAAAKKAYAVFVAKIGDAPSPHDNLTGAIVVRIASLGDKVEFFNAGCASFSATATADGDVANAINTIAGFDNGQ